VRALPRPLVRLTAGLLLSCLASCGREGADSAGGKAVVVAGPQGGNIQPHRDGVVGRRRREVVDLSLGEVQSGEVDGHRREHDHHQQRGREEQQRAGPVAGRPHGPTAQVARPGSPLR
jgi:hypothetical protein